ADVAVADRLSGHDLAIAAHIVHRHRLPVDGVEVAADLLDLHSAHAVQLDIAARRARKCQRFSRVYLDIAADILQPHRPCDILDLDIAADIAGVERPKAARRKIAANFLDQQLGVGWDAQPQILIGVLDHQRLVALAEPAHRTIRFDLDVALVPHLDLQIARAAAQHNPWRVAGGGSLCARQSLQSVSPKKNRTLHRAPNLPPATTS